MSAPAPNAWKPTDWWRVDQIVLLHCPMKPWEIDDLTLSEITLIISDPHRQTPEGGISPEDAAAGVAMWRGMNHREKLEWLRLYG